MDEKEKMNREEIAQKGISSLPRNLEAALNELEQDELLRNVLTEELLIPYVASKRKECEEYHRLVTEWEIKKYLEIY